MEAVDQASLRVLQWRVKGLIHRLGQAALIAVLVWVQIRSSWAFGWLVLAVSTALVDAALSRRLISRLHDHKLALANDITRTISSVSFASVCLLMLMDRSGFGLAAAVLAACAINLNNAMMTAGVRRFTLSLMAPPSMVLTALPLTAWATGHALTMTAAVVLTVGALACAIFIVRLAESLFREGNALRAALEAAEAASRAKSSFLAVTSHEIRTPLNGVLGMAQAMENDELSPGQRARVGVIRQSGAALLDLLNDILDLSKIEAGKLDLEHAPFDLAAVVESAVSAFSATAVNKGLAIELAFDPSARGSFDGDAARVRQVLCNLVSNAVKFTEAGSIVVSAATRPGGVRLSVADTGPGVPPGFADRLFEKFTQADASTTRRFGGTGLGLAISRELCEAMGGAISLESPPSGGAIFIVDLPLAHSRAADAPAAPVAAEAPWDGERPLRVLAAEDNPVNQLVLRTLLEQIGVETTLVETGAEAVDAWARGGFDLILMDVQMPQMDGPEATRVIRARESAAGRPHTPIVALTANVMSHQVETYLAAGMDAFVAKPIAIAELYAVIAQVAGAAEPPHADEAADRVA